MALFSAADGEQPMMVTISCPACGHVGLVSAGSLPRVLTCSSCNASRYVKVEDGARIKNPVAVMERILGEARSIDMAGGSAR
jgi:hypothetical protein